MKALCLAVAALTACAAVHAGGGEKDSERVVRAMFDAFNRHDADGMASLYASDAVLLSPDFCAPRRGRDDVRRTYQALFDEAPDIVDTVEQMVVQGDRVAVLFRSRGNMRGEPFELPIAAFITVSSGRIVRDESVFQPPPGTCSP